MLIKGSSALRNKYGEISRLARESNEPIYITNNGESDVVLMSVEAFERREQALKLRTRIINAEEERIRGAATVGLKDAAKILDQRLEDSDEL